MIIVSVYFISSYNVMLCNEHDRMPFSIPHPGPISAPWYTGVGLVWGVMWRRVFSIVFEVDKNGLCKIFIIKRWFLHHVRVNTENDVYIMTLNFDSRNLLKVFCVHVIQLFSKINILWQFEFNFLLHFYKDHCHVYLCHLDYM